MSTVAAALAAVHVRNPNEADHKPDPQDTTHEPKALTHPSYSHMIEDAISALKERKGSSRVAILKYIMNNYTIDLPEKTINSHLRVALNKEVDDGILKHTTGRGASGSFTFAKKGSGNVGKSGRKTVKKPVVKKSSSLKKSPYKKKAMTSRKAAETKKMETSSDAKDHTSNEELYAKRVASLQKAAADKKATHDKRVATGKRVAAARRASSLISHTDNDSNLDQSTSGDEDMDTDNTNGVAAGRKGSFVKASKRHSSVDI